MAKRPSTARGIKAAGVFVSTYHWSYPCTPDRLWSALTRDIGKWWPRDFLAQAGSRRMILESKVGGMMREEGPGGAGLVWGTVWAVEPRSTLLLVGHTTPRFGGPSTGTMEFRVDAEKAGAALRLTHGLFGKADNATRRSLDEGRNALFDSALRAHLQVRAVVSTAKRPRVPPHRA